MVRAFDALGCVYESPLTNVLKKIDNPYLSLGILLVVSMGGIIPLL